MQKPIVDLSTPIRVLRGVGPKRSIDFEKAGIRTVEDLLFFLPIRYEDRRQLRLISSLQPKESVLVEGKIVDARMIKTRRRGFSIFAVAIQDESGSIQAVWFNQPWLEEKLLVGTTLTLFGEVGFDRSGRSIQLSNPKFEMSEGDKKTGVVPVYQRARDISGWVIGKIIHSILDEYDLKLASAVPASLRSKLNMLPADEALRRIHIPPEDVDVNALNRASDRAHRSLVFEEFFILQAGLALRKQNDRDEESGIQFSTSPAMRETLKSMLPFKLTDGQRNAFKDIVGDMTSPHAMRRLLQGDVGCGKTIVALLSAMLAMENGQQAAFMAPTELLAEQHFASVKKHLSHTRYRIGYLTGSLTIKDRETLRKQIAEGEVDLVIGTHAMIQEGVHYMKLGLAIIDEQHRFGVLQRAKLLKLAAGTNPDLLIMTATPIPRSLTLTLFGDLNISIIRDMPPGRQKIITAVRTERSRNKINVFLESQMKEGRQIYSVAPVIEESKDGELKTATEMFERLSNTFSGRKVGLLHGRLSNDDRERVMNAFAAGKLDMIASTTVIEVGIDVANASVIIIENAERFGLSQLHQLRGRVGRGTHKSYCILLYQQTKSENARKRLETMVQTDDGFVIAEKDLEIRGPGDFFGTRQSGIPSLRIGNIIRDVELLQKARAIAFDYIADNDSKIAAEKTSVIKHINKVWEHRYGLVLVG